MAQLDSTIIYGDLQINNNLKVLSEADIKVIKSINDSTSMLSIQKSDGSIILNIDSTNKRVGILNTSPTVALDVTGDIKSSNKITANTFESTASTGIKPLTISSTTKVDNLNADMIDDLHASSFLRSDVDTTLAYGKKFYFAGMSGSTDPFYIVRSDTDVNTSDLQLHIEDDANGSEQFSIWSGGAVRHQFLSNGNAYHTGKLGVGTTNPSESIETTGNIKASVLISSVVNGTAPLQVTSQTKVNNLNADMVDDKHASDFVLKSGDTMTGLLTLSGDPTGNFNPATKQYVDRKIQWINMNTYRAYEPLNVYPKGISVMKYNSALSNSGWPFTAGIVLTVGSLDTTNNNQSGIMWHGSYHQIVFKESGSNIYKRYATVDPTYTSTQWSANQSISLNSYIIPTTANQNGYYYQCITAGTTGSTEPIWPTNVNDTVTDGTVVWKCLGKYWSDWDIIWTKNTDGHGSGLDADTVDGKEMPDIELLLGAIGIYQSGSYTNQTNAVGFEMTIDSTSSKITTFAKGTNKDNIKPIDIGKNYDGTYTSLLRINTDGKIGIGTTTPDTLLSVNGKARIAGDGGTIGGSNLGNAYLLVGSTTNGIGIDNNEIIQKGNNLYIGVADDNKYIYFMKQSTTQAAIDLQNARLGIGISSPTKALDVSGDIKLTGHIYKNSYVGFVDTSESAQAIKIGSLSVTDTYTDTTPSTNNAYIKGNLGLGIVNPTQIFSSAGMFAGVTPKLEILTGTSSSSSYEECVVIRHSGIDNQTVLRRLGLLFKLSNEADAAENSKMGGIVFDSSSQYANSPELSLVTNNSKRLSITYDGKIKLNTTRTDFSVTIGGSFGSTNGTDYFYYNGMADVVLKYEARGSGGRAIVHDASNVLTLNYNGDFSGGTKLGKNVLFAADTGNSYISTGNLGIGTANPDKKLHFYDSSPTGSYYGSVVKALFDADDMQMQLRSADTGTYGSCIILTTGNQSWTLESTTSGNNNKLYIGYKISSANNDDIIANSSKYITLLPNGSSCKVGINTTNPQYALEVNGDIKVTGDWYWIPNNKNFRLEATANNQEWSFDLKNQNSYTGCYWHVWSDKNSRTILSVRGDTERVGILTTNPTEALDVQGNIAVTGTVDGVDISSFKSEYDSYRDNILAKRRRYTKVLTSNIQQGVAITLTSIDSTWTGTWTSSSIVLVIVNGLISAEGIDYTRSGTNTITFNYDIPLGSVLDIIIM